MSYHILPSGEIWQDGVFCVPKAIAEKSLKFADEVQIKALIYLLSNSGTAEAQPLSKAVGCTVEQAEECLEFWHYEGLLAKDGEEKKPPKKEEAPAPKPVFENLPVPVLGPKDIVNICSENEELADLLRSAEVILAKSLSTALKGNIINMVTYYGLPPSVVVTLLEYYKSEHDAGRSITPRKLQLIAKDWANEEVSTIEQASAKLLEISETENLWLKVLDMCELDYMKMTSVFRKMLIRWRADFDFEMIAFACNTMKKYTEEEKRGVKAVDNILKEWKRKGFKTPADVKAQPNKEDKPVKKGNLKSKPSYDLEEIKKRSALNDDYDV